MDWLEITLFILALLGLLLINTVGVFMVALQLPGTWTLAAATALFAWAYWDFHGPEHPIIGFWTLGALLVLGVLGEIVEGAAGAVGAKGAGGTKRGMVLAIGLGIIGAILGTVFLPIPIVGTLVGAAVGSGSGSILGDLWAGREWRPALRSGRGAAIGRFAGSVGKLLIGGVMWLIVVVALIWP